MPASYRETYHPQYQRFARAWRMAWDFWRGGQHVLCPSSDIYTARDLVFTGDSDPDRPRQVKRSLNRAIRSYLWKDQTETIAEFDERQARAVVIPGFSEWINTYVTSISATAPARGFDSPFWADFLQSVDDRGTEADVFWRTTAAMGLVFGRSHVLSDADPSLASSPVSRLAEMAGGQTGVYWQTVTPLALVDWSETPRGDFRWVVIEQPGGDAREPGVEHGDDIIMHRWIWTADEWILTEQRQTPGAVDTDFVEIDRGENVLGRVPLSTFWACRDDAARDLACESPLVDGLYMTRYLYNKSSELDVIERFQSFGIMGIPSDDGSPPGPIDIAPSRYISFPPGASPVWITPDSDLADSKLSRIVQLKNEQARALGAGRGAADLSKEERSGRALELELEPRQNRVVAWRKSLLQCERQAAADVAELAGTDPYTVSLPSADDVRAVAQPTEGE